MQMQKSFHERIAWNVFCTDWNNLILRGLKNFEILEHLSKNLAESENGAIASTARAIFFFTHSTDQ